MDKLIDDDLIIENLKKSLLTESIYGYSNNDYVLKMAKQIYDKYLGTVQKRYIFQENHKLYNINDIVKNVATEAFNTRYPSFKNADYEKMESISNNSLYKKDPTIQLLNNIDSFSILFQFEGLGREKPAKTLKRDGSITISLDSRECRGEKGKNECIEFIYHELIHVLDGIRAKDASRYSYSKKAIKNLTSGDKSKMWSTYLSDTLEFNQAINNFLNYAMHRSGTINDYDQLLSLVFYNADWSKVKDDKGFEKKLIARLYREGFFTNPKYKIKYEPMDKDHIVKDKVRDYGRGYENMSMEKATKIANTRKEPINMMSEDVIEEGISHFKTSKQLYKLSDKLTNKASLTYEKEDRETIVTLSGKVNNLARKFEAVEDQYSSGDRKPALRKYQELKKDYDDILKIMSKDSTRNILRTVKVLSFTLISLTVPYLLFGKLFPNLASKSPTSIVGNAQVAGVTNTKSNTLTLLKRSGALAACGIPVTMMSRLTDSAINNIQNDDELLNKLYGALSQRGELV